MAHVLTMNDALNECVYLYSATKASESTCIARKRYWSTIHKHRADVLGKRALVEIPPTNLPPMLQVQAF